MPPVGQFMYQTKFLFSFPIEREGAGRLLETNVTIISNEECYEKLNNILTSNINGYNVRAQIKQATYDGITDQLLCTEGLIIEKEVCRPNGKRCRKRKFITVSFNYMLQHTAFLYI